MLEEQAPDFEDLDDEPTAEFVPTLDDDDTDVVDFVPDEMPAPCWALMGFVTDRPVDPALRYHPEDRNRVRPTAECTYALLSSEILDCLEESHALTIQALREETQCEVSRTVSRMVQEGLVERCGRHIVLPGDPRGRAAVAAATTVENGLRGVVVAYLREQGGKALTRAVVRACAAGGDARRNSVSNAIGDLRRLGIIRKPRVVGLVELAVEK